GVIVEAQELSIVEAVQMRMVRRRPVAVNAQRVVDLLPVGRRDQQPAAGPHHPHQDRHKAVGAGHMLDHLDGDHRVEGPIGEGQGVSVGYQAPPLPTSRIQDAPAGTSRMMV
ncbi:MAG: hypothetical protein WBA12_13480, partial [Catalinimonas sp.]